MLDVSFRQFTCHVHFARYGNGAIALILKRANDGERIAVASVNLDDETMAKLPPGAIYVKSWSENAGMVEALIAAGVIEPDPLPGTLARAGFVACEAYQLTNAALLDMAVQA